MKKILMPFAIAIALLVTVASCTPEEKVSMIGTYEGNIKTNAPLKIKVATVDMDTTFTTMAGTAIIAETESEDTLGLTVKLEIDGVPINIENIPAYKVSDSKITITNYIFKYADAFPMYVNGAATLDGTTLTANVKLSNAPSSLAGTSFDGDLTFTGEKK